MIGRLYTLGSAHPNAVATMQALMASDSQMLLVDIRYTPRSRWFPQWSQKTLQTAWGDRYRHVKALGNVNYRHSAAPFNWQTLMRILRERCRPGIRDIR